MLRKRPSYAGIPQEWCILTKFICINVASHTNLQAKSSARKEDLWCFHSLYTLMMHPQAQYVAAKLVAARPALPPMERLLKDRFGEMLTGLQAHGPAYQSSALPPLMTAVGKAILRAYRFSANSAY